jgi:exportin-2 (importin alpha re-exporter)
MIIVHVWAPRLKEEPPVQRVESKIHVIGVTKLLCEYPAMLSDANGQNAWLETLKGLISLVTSPKYKDSIATKLVDETEMETGYDAQYSRLVQATKIIEDPFVEIVDPNMFFVQSLQTLRMNNSAILTPLLQHGCSGDPKLNAGLEYIYQQAGMQF